MIAIIVFLYSEYGVWSSRHLSKQRVHLLLKLFRENNSLNHFTNHSLFINHYGDGKNFPFIKHSFRLFISQSDGV